MINSGPFWSEWFILDPGRLCGFTAFMAMESEGPNQRLHDDLLWLKAVSVSGGLSPSLRVRFGSGVYTHPPKLRGA